MTDRPTPRSDAPRRRGRPSTLSRDRIIEEAAALIDETGSLNVSSIGARLGVDPSAVYRHFRSRSDLVSALTDWFLSPLAETPTVTANWRDDFVTQLRALERLYRSRPAVTAVFLTEADLSGVGLELVARMMRTATRSGAPEAFLFETLHAIEVAFVGSVMYDSIGAPHDDDVRRTYHRRLGVFDVDSLYPTPADLVEESSRSMWLVVDAMLDRIEAQGRPSAGVPDGRP